MAGKKSYQPVYCQFIAEIEKGFLLLDKTSQAEVVDFVRTQQHENGAFINRAGNPDFYYSLFGVWLAKALNLEEQLILLKEFILTVHLKELKVVDKFSVLLIRLVLEEKDFKRLTFFELFSWVQKGGKNLNTAYRFFLFMLSFDALFGRNRVVYFFIRIFLNVYQPSNDFPCSFYAALLLAKHLSGKKIKKEKAVLLHYFEKGKGFKSYNETENADLLSTAVALFVLKKTDIDLRIVAPDCLNLVQENYESGAFLPGDGDSSRDLEYTFYGLLILGVLS